MLSNVSHDLLHKRIKEYNDRDFVTSDEVNGIIYNLGIISKKENGYSARMHSEIIDYLFDIKYDDKIKQERKKGFINWIKMYFINDK